MTQLGSLRPSQLIFTFGIGSLVDLPNMSVLVLGLDDWDTAACTEITEERLVVALRKRLGNQLGSLFLPPIGKDAQPLGAVAAGVPVAPFPRWHRCPRCNALATVDSGIFTLRRDQWRPDRTRYVHSTCAKGGAGAGPTTLPARFLIACRNGHLADFPWREYVHGAATPCKPGRYTLKQSGAAGDASDVWVECLECGKSQSMGKAFDRDAPFGCSGLHPHLRRTDHKKCEEEGRAVLLGASNTWFPLVISALTIPASSNDLLQLIDENWPALRDIPSLEVAKYVCSPTRLPALGAYQVEELWAAIEKKKGGEPIASTVDLKEDEWKTLALDENPPVTKEFKIRKVAPPADFESFFKETSILDCLREVRAIAGFTRIESKGDFADAAYTDDGRQTALSNQPPTWLPASEVRGEGFFLRLNEKALGKWEKRKEVNDLSEMFVRVHKRWRELRNIVPPAANFPGMRFVLLHTLAHALIRQISLECGYTAASIRERIYCRMPKKDTDPMAGILIYTAASDSEGTLGGLIQLAEPKVLGRHIAQALESMRLCSSDPVCSEHEPTNDGRGIHGACCHACLFAPETSCEKGNLYLDRSVLVPTFANRGCEFFTDQ